MYPQDRYNPFTLEGKTILITGASSGIGRATAIECSRMGATVVLTARNEERLQETLSQMSGEGHQILTADLSNEDDIMALAAATPALNGVVNCAGYTEIKPLKFLSQKMLDGIFGANLFSAMQLTRHLLKKKKIQNAASLVFLSSLATTAPSKGNGAYEATKSALEAYSRACAVELAERGIRSNSIHPGMVETEFLQSLAEDMDSFSINKAADEQRYLMKRYGKPEDVAWMAIYLLSDASAWVTGTAMIIDGGRRINFE